MEKFITKVTVTGADDSVEAEDLIEIAREYPFVEFGILLSKKSMGNRPRYPSEKWLLSLKKLAEGEGAIRLSAHICGNWLDEILDSSYLPDYVAANISMFERLQLNLYKKMYEREDIVEELVMLSAKIEQDLILPYNGDDDFFEPLASRSRISVIYDASRGRGTLPGEWQKPFGNIPCGYAGGLSPENLGDQLLKLQAVVGDKAVWIDAESRLRSNNDAQFDLNKVKGFLEVASQFVSGYYLQTES